MVEEEWERGKGDWEKCEFVWKEKYAWNKEQSDRRQEKVAKY